MHARGVGEQLDLAVDLFVACIVPTVGIAFLMWLPVRIVWVLLGRANNEPELFQGIFNFLGSTLVQWLSVAFVIQVVYAELQGQRTSLGQAMLVAIKRAPALLLCVGIITVATAAGCCLVVPWIFLSFIWSVAPAALVLERCGPLECLGRSQRLVRKSFFRWAGLILCVQALKIPYDSTAVALDMPQIRNWAVEDLHVSSMVYSFAQVLLPSFLLAISAAVWAIVITVFYLDCRVRQEGFDLAMRLERVQNADKLGRAR